jgi:hypothetical protein
MTDVQTMELCDCLLALIGLGMEETAARERLSYAMRSGEVCVSTMTSEQGLRPVAPSAIDFVSEDVITSGIYHTADDRGLWLEGRKMVIRSDHWAEFVGAVDE